MQRRASQVQDDFARRLDEIVARRPDTPRDLEVSVYSYCGAKGFLDQMVTLRSFLRGIGAPKKFVVVSDGTLTGAHKTHLTANHPCVECCELDGLGASFPVEVAALAEEKMPGFAFNNKLLLLMAISSSQEPCIYTDSDIMFFPAPDLSPLLDFDSELYYSRDFAWSLDPRLLTPTTGAETPDMEPTNAGFCLFGREPDWKDALQPLHSFQGVPSHFSEQTIVHNMMRFNGACQLPPDRFLLTIEDIDVLSDPVLSGRAVMRHYVGAVRYKMWLLAPHFYS